MPSQNSNAPASFDTDFDAKTDLAVVIMAGGAGTRFWPSSTKERPKQFLRLFGERSLLQQAYDRVASLVGAERIIVLTSTAFEGICREQLPELPTNNIVGEPCRRDTAAAVALAALLVKRALGDPVMAVLTADHLIGPTDAFQRTLLSAAAGASDGKALYTLGIAPSRPETGYGYLALADPLGTANEVEHHALECFVEKPNFEKAKAYVEGGRHLWNSGMFLWRTSAILSEFETHLPKHLASLQPALELDDDSALLAALPACFEQLVKVSIDFGIMEKAKRVHCVKAAFDWSDVGGFPSLAEHLPADQNGNIARGRIHTLDAKDNLIFCDDSDEDVALIGVEGLIVVRSAGRTLVVPRDRAQDIKKLVENLPSRIN